MSDKRPYNYSAVYEALEEAGNADDIENKMKAFFGATGPNGTIPGPDSTVLGIDVYKYSEYPQIQQMLVPVIFRDLMGRTISMIEMEEPTIFCDVNPIREHIDKHFIDTGDGGFLIFKNPLQAISFALGFELFLRAFQVGAILPNGREYLKEISVRYCITTGDVYTYEYSDAYSNHYGQAIIDCARILAKDKLNRCLIDKKTHDWFYDSIYGIENLRVVRTDKIKTIEYIEQTLKGKAVQTTMFSEGGLNHIDKVDILKIGKIKSKNTEGLDIYNLHIQAVSALGNPGDKVREQLAITLGNLNTTGITDE